LGCAWAARTYQRVEDNASHLGWIGPPRRDDAELVAEGARYQAAEPRIFANALRTRVPPPRAEASPCISRDDAFSAAGATVSVSLGQRPRMTGWKRDSCLSGDERWPLRLRRIRPT